MVGLERQALKILLIVMVISFAVAAMLWDSDENILQSFSVDARETMPIAGVQRIAVESVSTRVEVIPGTGPDLEVHYTGEGQLMRGSLPELRVRRRGDTVTVELASTSSRISFLSASVTLTVLVPPQYQGAVEVKSSSGSVNCRDLAGLTNLTVNSVSGRSSVENVNLSGRLQLESSSGAASVATTAARGVNIRTASGRISVELTAVSDVVDLQSSSGSVRLTMPAGSEFSVQARSASGSVTNPRGIPSQGATERNSFTGQVGSSGPHVSVRTASGSITLQ